MQHKGVLLVVLAMLLLVAVPSMAQDAAATPEVELPEPWSCPEGFAGQTLSVYNWSTYIAEDTVANFEALCGVTVIYDVYDNNESMIASLSQGNPGYDIVVPTDYAVAQMIDRGLLQPLNLDNIPNFANLSDFLLDQVFDPGNQYSVPYQWGTIGIGYNIEAVGYEITSWEDVWNYNGPVAWLEEPRPMLGFALMLLGLDPNTTDPREIEMARDYLIERGGNVVAIAADDGQVFLERGDAHIVIEYSGDIFQLVATCECDTYRFVIPSEGAERWMDNLAIPTGARNPALAEVWIDYILDPYVGADISNYTAYASPNQLSIDLGLIDEEYLSSPIIYPSEEISETLFGISYLPEAETLYSRAWDELKVLLGR